MNILMGACQLCFLLLISSSLPLLLLPPSLLLSTRFLLLCFLLMIPPPSFSLIQAEAIPCRWLWWINYWLVLWRLQQCTSLPPLSPHSLSVLPSAPLHPLLLSSFALVCLFSTFDWLSIEILFAFSGSSPCHATPTCLCTVATSSTRTISAPPSHPPPP